LTPSSHTSKARHLLRRTGSPFFSAQKPSQGKGEGVNVGLGLSLPFFSLRALPSPNSDRT
jgi:hypothetical protein